MTPMERLHETRLAAARRLLAEGAMPVLEVAGAVGFRSASHFAVWFREQTGMSPTAYREASGEIAESKEH
ncbi:helix-turn-helix domain-containing protein [Gordoniibacillus kamchatkensis]|uniref:helix-turn-helix domain-containing protein n=1 Tax=Gordoniibacillus kamchatkensis TaxID=1590651 RepID=UPI000A66006E|nr:helix-turn-helix domain-containing protein [Paenibacillus sp. VKM B-2647]